MPEQKCYFCGSLGTTKEHAPAKCFFPSEAQYRIELITVPSCTKHNSETSKDDEYVRNIITMHYSNNAVAFKHFLDKTYRSLLHSPAMASALFRRTKPVTRIPGGAFAFQIDRNRFDDVLRKIAYAIYFHEKRVPWNVPLNIITDCILTDSLSTDSYGKLIEWADASFPIIPYAGSNPKVFKYQILSSEPDSLKTVIRIIFYEGFKVYAVPLDEGISE